MTTKGSGTKIIRIDDHVTTLTLPKSKLMVVTDGIPQRDYVVTKDTIRIGTAPDNELVLNDDTVSRLHAEILKTKDGYLIRDLGSTNGTFVGNVRVKEVFFNRKFGDSCG
jgi:hypothetical protein